MPNTQSDPDLLPPVGTQVKITIEAKVGNEVYRARSLEDYPGHGVHVHMKYYQDLSIGESMEAWVFQHPVEGEPIRVSIDNYGTSTISEPMAARYVQRCELMLDLLQNGWHPASPPVDMDILGQARGMLTQCLETNQKAWFSVWKAMGEPSPEQMEAIQRVSFELKTGIKGQDHDRANRALEKLRELGAQALYANAKHRIEGGVTQCQESHESNVVMNASEASHPIIRCEETGLDPDSVQSTRQFTTTRRSRRPGQAQFRSDLRSAYANRGAITNCRISKVLEAAHIHKFDGDDTNIVSNGLLLRVDIHRLFDSGLIGIDQKYRVLVSSSLNGTEYEEFRGEPIRLPVNPGKRPSKQCLKAHQENFGL